MKKSNFAAVLVIASNLGWAAPPSENVVKSCLQLVSASPAVEVKTLDVGEVFQEDDYADGFDAKYAFKYGGADVGYAERKAEQALIYSGKIYPLAKAMPTGDNRGIKPSAFNPTLAQWGIVREGREKYLCVSFNFDGLGRSGSYQNVHGGYLLNSKTKGLYFVVRDVRQ
ncbi:hypothetical protein [Paraburkholderia acidipaludis]|uniref:hypothetical protein n=1 Tax=Paraburkholderia acidipaludis TaxID=660537 RepID=UPI0012EB7729|nr:hypothetical protein [Paraburkholderia acidipaludis]